MKRCSLWLAVVASLSIGACGSTTEPSTTTTTTATPTLGISPPTTALAVGQTQAYTVINAAATDVITWSSSDAAILQVDSAGNATGIARGSVTLTATSSAGTTATLPIQVAPNYQGNWSGNTTVTACTDIGGFATNNYCAQRIRTTQRITMSLTQTGLGIGGTVTVTEPGGQVSGPVSGAIGAGGDITTLVGTLTGVVGGANLSTALISWNSLASTSGMTGNFAATSTSSQIVGIATVQWQFGGVARTASTVQGSGLRGILPMFARR